MTRLLTLAMLIVLIRPAAARAEVIVTVGVDPTPPGEERRADHPLSDAAKSQFLANLQTQRIGYQDFESFDVNAGVQQVTFTPNVSTMITDWAISSFFIAETNPAGLGFDMAYATSGKQYVYTSTEADTPYFSVHFSTPVSAVGFYAIDMNREILAVARTGLQIHLIHDGGQVTDLFTDQAVYVEPNGSVAFIGITSLDRPIERMEWRWSNVLGDSGFGFDDMIVAVPVPEPLGSGGVVAGILTLVVARIRRKRASHQLGLESSSTRVADSANTQRRRRSPLSAFFTADYPRAGGL